jgi:hypothetical protein
VEFDDELIFLLGEISTFEVGAEIVDPPETATLTATEKTSGFWERAPASLTVSSNISNQPLIFFFAPCSFVYVTFLTARGPSHIDQFYLYIFDDHSLTCFIDSFLSIFLISLHFRVNEYKKHRLMYVLYLYIIYGIGVGWFVIDL